jgi:asparagine synthetase B (glutamine-hydrolysing)
MTREEVLKALPEVIALLGTWDITTIRASMGMYLCCKAIHERTDIRVLLTGEISDELFGYKYTDFAPSAEAFQQEAKKRVDELYMYDVLRADRCISANSMEARVPFGDLDFRAVRHEPWTPPSSSTPTAWANICCATPLKRTACCPTRSSGGRRPPSPTRWATPWWTT